MKAHSNTVISTEFGRINPDSSVNMATWPPTFASISKVTIRHGIANRWQCIVIKMIKCHVMQAIALCSGQSQEALRENPDITHTHTHTHTHAHTRTHSDTHTHTHTHTHAFNTHTHKRAYSRRGRRHLGSTPKSALSGRRALSGAVNRN